MHEFVNQFTGRKFLGTIDQLYRLEEGEKETILCKSDIVKSFGWSWDSSLIIIK